MENREQQSPKNYQQPTAEQLPQQAVQSEEKPKSKKLTVAISIVSVLLIVGCVLAYFVFLSQQEGSSALEKVMNLFVEKESKESVVCAMDVKICPGGHYVARVAPDCEFAACPATEEEDLTAEVSCEEEFKASCCFSYGENFIGFVKPLDTSKIVSDSGVEFVGEQILIMFRDGLSEEEIRAKIVGIGGEIAGCLTMLNTFQIDFPGASPEELGVLIDKLNKDSDIEVAKYNYINRALD